MSLRDRKGVWWGTGWVLVPSELGKPLRKELERCPEMEKGDTHCHHLGRHLERPEMKQKENIERRTFRAAPEEGAWERTTSGWLYPSQVPSMQVVQLLSTALSQTQNFMSCQKQRKKVPWGKVSLPLLPAGPRRRAYQHKKKSSLIPALELIPAQQGVLGCV